ncbi:MAG TPA: branched-chain amino acid ABC transporter permease [Stellaceae bacterium]
MTADQRAGAPTPVPIADTAVADFRARARWQWYEPIFWLGAIAWYFLFPTYLPLGTQILCAALFALSLDLILGYGGIVSLGHTTFFGVGAYTAGLLAKNGWGEPVTCLLAAAAAAAIVGWVCSFVIVRVQGVALLLVTLGINLVLYEVANKAYTITGGADGLQGIAFKPLFGAFDYDIYGRVSYIYTLAVVFLMFLVARRIVYSPFGLALKGMRENWKRMPALGAALRRHGALIFVLSAAIAGVAGALLAESVQFVALDSLGPQRSIDVLTMLIVGGTGVLYGSFVGATVYMVARDQLADINPAYWYFWIGLMLVVVVLFTRNGVVGALSDLWDWLRRKRHRRGPA